jgi:hypothetical protein
MGLLQHLGLDDLADSVNEFTSGFDELRDEIISSVIGPGEELKNTVDDIAGSVTGASSPETLTEE